MCAIAQQNERTQLIERRRERRRVRNKFGIVADDIVQLIYDQLMKIVHSKFKVLRFGQKQLGKMLTIITNHRIADADDYWMNEICWRS